LVVIIVEEVQCPAVLANHAEKRGGLIAGKIPVFRHGRHQPDRLLEFLQPTLVDGVAFHQMITQ
jgi:hypothetical protein